MIVYFFSIFLVYLYLDFVEVVYDQMMVIVKMWTLLYGLTEKYVDHILLM